MDHEDSGPSDLTFDMLVRAWELGDDDKEPEFSSDQYRFKLYSEMMRPYLAQPFPVQLAAYRLASSLVNNRPLDPAQVEEAIATLRAAGIPWGQD